MKLIVFVDIRRVLFSLKLIKAAQQEIGGFFFYIFRKTFEDKIAMESLIKAVLLYSSIIIKSYIIL